MRLVRRSVRGFTLLELSVVIAIIGLLAAVVIASLSDSRAKGRDAARQAQAQEFLKALELYFTDGGTYPADSGGAGFYLNDIESSLVSSGYISDVPPGPLNGDSEYRYCANGISYVLMVFTENRTGAVGSAYCNITRGTGPDYGCDFTAGNGGDFFGNGAQGGADDPCSSRF
jgi:prepilin-type N-terminal cleavage/methylation domain-containing protein